jgi:hypothetical protein
VSPPVERSYLYAVVTDTDALHIEGEGLDGQPVKVVRDGGLAALVSPFSKGRVEARRAHLAAHERVVEAARGAGPVIPVRFGVLMNDRAVLEDVLRSRRRELRRLLAELDGTVEMRVQASYHPDVLLSEAVRANPAILRLRKRLDGRPASATYFDRIRLGELVAAAAEHVREADASALMRRLSARAVKARSLAARSEEVAMNAAFLVRERDAGRFDQELERVAAEEFQRLRFRVVGPLAAWDFVDVDLGGADSERMLSGARG